MTADTPALRIHSEADTIAFTADELTECMWAPASVLKSSNSAYHRMGKPTWWVRVGDTFLKIDYTRADSDCPNIDPEQIIAAMQKPSGELTIGYGKIAHKDARRWRFTLTRT